MYGNRAGTKRVRSDPPHDEAPRDSAVSIDELAHFESELSVTGLCEPRPLHVGSSQSSTIFENSSPGMDYFMEDSARASSHWIGSPNDNLTHSVGEAASQFQELGINHDLELESALLAGSLEENNLMRGMSVEEMDEEVCNILNDVAGPSTPRSSFFDVPSGRARAPAPDAEKMRWEMAMRARSAARGVPIPPGGIPIGGGAPGAGGLNCRQGSFTSTGGPGGAPFSFSPMASPGSTYMKYASPRQSAGSVSGGLWPSLSPSYSAIDYALGSPCMNNTFYLTTVPPTGATRPPQPGPTSTMISNGL